METIKWEDEHIFQEVDSIIEKYWEEKSPLLCVLQEISLRWHYLPRPLMQHVAEKLDVPSSKVYGVATFYSFLETEPIGQHVVRVCESAPCHVRGAMDVLSTLKRELGIKEGETTRDGKFTLEVTSCLGVCGVAPAMMIDQVTYGNLTPERIREVLTLYN
ncbi:MAG: NADH-quinone oxidoreductase subunit [Candidatus Atribacteria bacterium]|nr:NADH-quinone oxidoreductase subunit [Candidatus Atribacteria bacterium]